MALNEQCKKMRWKITITSKQNWSDADRDFIAELVSEEARKTKHPLTFTVDDIIESKKYCKILLIESTKAALTHLLSVIENNLFCAVSYEEWKA